MRLLKIISVVLLFSMKLPAQFDNADSSAVEIFVIDSYVTPETPNKFVLSFFTSDSCTSKLLILDKYTFDVSKALSENHKIEIELSKLKLDSVAVKYVIIVYDRKAKETRSDLLEVEIPKEIVISPEQDVGLWRVCLGGIVFAIPSVSYVRMNNQNYRSLGKEIPLLSFYSIGYNYPAGYISAEYAHIFNSDKKNFLRIGYKQIFQIPAIEYISPGLDYFTNFLGYNGVSTELTFGLFRIQNAFTFYTRYRYNFQLIKNSPDFHELSIGLFSNFFSINF